MPITGTESVLSATLKALLIADPNGVDNDSMQALCDGIASAVIGHIVANGIASPLPNPTAGATGLISGAPGAPVTGTGGIL